MKQLVCLLAALCLLTGCAAPAPAGQAPAPSAPETPAPASEAEPPAAPPSDAPVLTCGDYAMTSAQFQYYFGQQYAAALDAYGSAFDPSKDLRGQSYDDSLSWADFLIDQAMRLAEQTQALCLAAEAEGFSPVEGAPLTDAIARGRGYTDAQALLTACYGEGAEPEGYAAFARDLATADAYSAELSRRGEFTEAELEAYYDAHAEDYKTVFHLEKNDVRPIDVRIIRFYPDDPSSEADWQAAEARARAAEAEFQKDPTDAAFAALADARTEDFKAPEGGLYPGLGPDGVGPLAEWLFPADGARAVGDTGLLRESDALALCYVSALGDRPGWQIAAEQDLRRENYIKALESLRQTWPFERHPENIDLRVPTAHEAGRFDGAQAVG